MIYASMFALQALAEPCEGNNLKLIATQDNAAICMERHPAKGAPVLLVHGISANRHFWNLDSEHSLPIHLQQQGFDVWNIDLRGRRGATRNAKGKKLNRTWSIDDYGRFDIDAAIKEINMQRPGEPIGFVGHSLGGMALASYLNTHGGEQLGTIVVIASPMDFKHSDPLMILADQAIGWTPATLPMPFFAHLAILLPSLSIYIERLIWNTDEMKPATRRKLLKTIVAPMTRNELRHLKKSINAGQYREANRNVDHAIGLGRINVPALFIAGRRDLIVPVDRCLAYYEAMGSKDKSFVIAGRAWGFSYDYGHSDYTLSRAVKTEIYPLITKWMKERLNADSTDK